MRRTANRTPVCKVFSSSALLVLLCLLSACAPGLSRVPNAEEGTASWYGPGFDGKLTANGETFDTTKLTAAHQTLPFDTLVRVTNLENNRVVVVRVNDRGPFVGGRILDLSQAAAEKLDMVGSGTAKVRLELLSEMPAASWRVGLSLEVTGYDALSRLHRPGELLLLKSAGESVLLRVVGGLPETAETDLLLSQPVYDSLDLGSLTVEPVSVVGP